MLNATKLVHALRATSSRNEKEHLLVTAFLEGERQFFVGASLAYDKLITFGVHKVPAIEEDDGVEGNFLFNDFIALAEKLRTRALTGNAAREAILDAIERVDFNDWNDFYRPILMKDLNVGIQPKTINKVLDRIAQGHPGADQFKVPVFGIQLAEDGTLEKNAKHLRGKKLLDLKLDGTRIVAVLNKEADSVTLFTRDGNIKENFPHINAALKNLLPHIPGSILLDGEMVARSFGELMEQMNRKNAKTSAMKFALFDLLPLVDFRAGECKIPQKDRHKILVALSTAPFWKEAVSDSVYVLPKVEVDLDTDEGQDALAEMRRATLASKNAGTQIDEGVMVKDPDGIWVADRTEAWLKLKPTISVSLTVTAIEQGKPDGRFAHTLGNLICEGVSDCGKTVKVSVGSGLKDWMRDEWFADPSKIIGWIVEVEADDFTLAKGATVYSLRFPRLKERRGTKPGEKI